MNDVADELEAALGVVGRLRAMPDAAAAARPAPGRWSPKEILGHLVDSAANNHQRFVRLQLQPNLELPGYEQEGWVRVQRWQDVPWAEIIELWRAYNRHLARLIRTVEPDALGRLWRRPDGVELDLELVMRDYVAHLKHHLGQILG